MEDWPLEYIESANVDDVLPMTRAEDKDTQWRRLPSQQVVIVAHLGIVNIAYDAKIDKVRGVGCHVRTYNTPLGTGYRLYLFPLYTENNSQATLDWREHVCSVAMVNTLPEVGTPLIATERHVVAKVCRILDMTQNHKLNTTSVIVLAREAARRIYAREFFLNAGDV